MKYKLSRYIDIELSYLSLISVTRMRQTWKTLFDTDQTTTTCMRCDTPQTLACSIIGSNKAVSGCQ